MAEKGVYKRFLRERKKSVKADVVNARKEYEGIMSYLQDLMQEIEVQSNDLLREQEYQVFVSKFGPAMNSIQDALGKLILVRLSLPDSSVNSTLCDDLVSESGVTDVLTRNTPASSATYLPTDPELTSTKVDSVKDDHSRYCDAYSSASVATDRPVTQRNQGAASAASSVPLLSNISAKMSASGGGYVQTLPKLELKEPTLEVSIIEVRLPWLFWVQRQSKTQELEDILDRLELHHSRYPADSPAYRCDNSVHLHLGALVSARYTRDDIWYRARIIAVYQNKGVEVFYIDYGNSEKLKLNRVRPLPADVQSYPCQAFACSLSQIGPVDGGFNWSQQVLAEFSQLIGGGQRLIHIREDAKTIPLVFTDIYSDAAAYRDRRTPSSSCVLVAKGLAREMSTTHVASWYSDECGKLVEPDATSSLRWIDIHHFQMPVVCFADSGAVARPSYSQSYVVGSVSLSTTATAGDKPTVAGAALPETPADCLQKEKMDRVGNWLKQEAHKRWKKVAVKMCVDDAPAVASAGGSRPGNGRPEVRPTHAEGELCEANSGEECKASNAWDKTSSCTRVPPESCLEQNAQHRSQSEMHDTPEKDVSSSDRSQPKQTRSSREYRSVEASINWTPSGDNPKSHDRRVSAGDSRERPLFTRAEDTPARSKTSSCSPSENKADLTPICDTVFRKHAHDNTVNSHSPKFCASNVQEKTNIEMSPPSATTDTKCGQKESDIPSIKLLDEESVVKGRKNRARQRASKKADSPSSPLLGVGLDTSVKKLSDQLIPPFSLVRAAENVATDRNISEDEVCSELSGSKSLVDKTRVMESDSYLTANETSSTVSASPPKKKLAVEPAAAALAKLSFKDRDGGPRVADDETELNDDTVTAADVRETSQHVPSVKLEVPESRRFAVLLSSVESPHRFWVNVASEQTTQVDWVTEVLNTSPLKPTDPASAVIELHSWYCVQNSADKLFYRAEVIEICYGDAHCQHGLTDASAACQCDQLLRPPTTAIVAVRVLSVDFGGKEWVEVSSLRELPDGLVDMPPFALCCRLANIEAVTGGDSGTADWSQQATHYLINVMEGKLFTAWLDESLPVGGVVSPCNRKPLAVRLTDETSDPVVDVADSLVSRGLARYLTDDSDSRPWNPMAEDYLSERNNYQVDVDDPGVAIVGYKAQDEERICRFYNTRGGCWRGETCPLEHTSNSDINVTTDRRATYCVDEYLMMTLPSVNSWVVVQVTHIFAPNHVCVCFPFGFSGSTDVQDIRDMTLEEFHEAINKHYSNKIRPDSDLVLPAIGELVVVRTTANERWYRAAVLGRDLDHNIKVLYIDYGDSEWVATERIRQIDPTFIHRPSQAVHCRLPYRPLSADGTWTTQSQSYFESAVSGKVLTAKVLAVGFDNSMYVELYDGEDNIVTEMIQAGVAAKSSPSPDTVRFHQRIDDNTTSVPSLTDEPEYVLIPG